MGFWQTFINRVDGWNWNSELADEASAYLEGRLLERQRTMGTGARVPAWLWLNAVAHGAPSLLNEIAEPLRPGVTVDRWRAVRAALAHEVLARTGGDPAAVTVLQREVLVPLEDRLNEVCDLTPATLHEIAIQEMRLIES